MLTNSPFPNNWTKNLGSSTHPVSWQSTSRRLVQLRPAILRNLFARTKIALS